jgi:glycosyltransferase involved in cell wall biosynthesis
MVSDRNPTVSVIIPTYNRAHLVHHAIGSVLDQSYRDLELIIVDDASTDDTERVVDGFSDPRIRHIRHSQNRGAPAARNAGITVARGSTIAFLDSDDEWLPEKLVRQLGVFGRENDPRVGVVYGGVQYIDETGRTLFERIPEHRGDILRCLLEGDVLPTSVAVVKAACFERIGLFDERLRGSEDLDFWIRAAKHYHFDSVPGLVARIRIHWGKERLSNQLDARLAGRELIYSKHQADYERHSLAGQYLYRTAKYYCLQGDGRKARRALRAAVRYDPTVLGYYAYLVLSYVGSAPHRLLSGARQELERMRSVLR